MSQYQAADLQTGFFAERSAVWIGWALLAAFSTMLLLASFDARRRRQLESFDEPTAVGDQTLFKAPTEAGAPTVALNFKGQALVPTSSKHVSERDVRMQRVGLDDSGVYRIYVDQENAEHGKKGDLNYFLKIGKDEFLEVRPQTPGH
jgi:hypothetical protein